MAQTCMSTNKMVETEEKSAKKSSEMETHTKHVEEKSIFDINNYCLFSGYPSPFLFSFPFSIINKLVLLKFIILIYFPNWLILKMEICMDLQKSIGLLFTNFLIRYQKKYNFFKFLKYVFEFCWNSSSALITHDFESIRSFSSRNLSFWWLTREFRTGSLYMQNLFLLRSSQLNFSIASVVFGKIHFWLYFG